jgi:hypothetical protein
MRFNPGLEQIELPLAYATLQNMAPRLKLKLIFSDEAEGGVGAVQLLFPYKYASAQARDIYLLDIVIAHL